MFGHHPEDGTVFTDLIMAILKDGVLDWKTKELLILKAILEERGLAFRERDVSDPAVLAEFSERLPRVRSIPQIFADGEHLGGYEDLRLWLSA